MSKIDIKKFPETLFDFPTIGTNLTREKATEIISAWSPAAVDEFLRRYPHYAEKKIEAVVNPPAGKEDKK
jgi:hypothetical protein